MRPTLARACLAAILVALVAAPAAHAVYNVRNVSWTSQFGTGPAANKTTIRLEFDADLTEAEITHGSTSFTVALLDRVTSPWTLEQFTVGPVVGRPEPGTTVHVELEIPLQCTDGAWLEVGRVESRLSRCAYEHPLKGRVEAYVLRTFGRSVPTRWLESFELGLVDEFGLVADAVLPIDESICLPLDDPSDPSNATPSIGVYFDEEGTQCEGSIAPGEVGKIYIVAKFGPKTQGMAGAEFRFAGVPETWQVWPVPNPEILALGDPFADGVTVGFSCTEPDAGRYVLYEVLVQAGNAQEDVVFSIESRLRSDRRNPDQGGCPLFVSCNPPRFSQTCVETAACFVNSTKAAPCATSVSVSQVTWGAVKQLFR